MGVSLEFERNSETKDGGVSVKGKGSECDFGGNAGFG